MLLLFAEEEVIFMINKTISQKKAQVARILKNIAKRNLEQRDSEDVEQDAKMAILALRRIGLANKGENAGRFFDMPLDVSEIIKSVEQGKLCEYASTKAQNLEKEIGAGEKEVELKSPKGIC